MAKTQACYKLAAHMMAAQMTQEEVAEKVLGCVPSTLSGYMTGSAPFPYKYIVKLAAEYNIPPSEWGEVFLMPYMIVSGLRADEALAI